MNFDGFVCGCGTYIEYKGKELLSNSFSNSYAKELIDDLHEYKIDSILEGKSGTYFDNDDLITYKCLTCSDKNALDRIPKMVQMIMNIYIISFYFLAYIGSQQIYKKVAILSIFKIILA